MCRIGDRVRWMTAIDVDYNYGEIIEIDRRRAVIRELGGYHAGSLVVVHFKYIEKLGRGGKYVGRSA